MNSIQSYPRGAREAPPVTQVPESEPAGRPGLLLGPSGFAGNQVAGKLDLLGGEEGDRLVRPRGR